MTDSKTPRMEAQEIAFLIANLHSVACGYTNSPAHKETAKRAIDVLTVLSADRDEWKQQHENLLSVRQSDLLELTAAQSALAQEREKGRRLMELARACIDPSPDLAVAEANAAALRDAIKEE